MTKHQRCYGLPSPRVPVGVGLARPGWPDVPAKLENLRVNPIDLLHQPFPPSSQRRNFPFGDFARRSQHSPAGGELGERRVHFVQGHSVNGWHRWVLPV